MKLPHLPVRLQERDGILSRASSTIFVLLPDSQLISAVSVTAAFKPYVGEADALPRVFSTQVPICPPKTAEQARLWSERYWPCVFNPASQTLQNAPPLHLLRATLAELETERTRIYMKLAQFVGQQCKQAGVGRKVGAVVIDPAKHEVIAAAGDARWWVPENQKSGRDAATRGEGRPEHHSLMRVIAQVAMKEVRRRRGDEHQAMISASTFSLNGDPIGFIESIYANAPERQEIGSADLSWLPHSQTMPRSDTYLCSGLDLYLTHEPCISCAMAMIHSRFRACIFAASMPETGSLSADVADNGLGYGLFWRSELNWRVMVFQHREDNPQSLQEPAQESSFHA